MSEMYRKMDLVHEVLSTAKIGSFNLRKYGTKKILQLNGREYFRLATESYSSLGRVGKKKIRK